MAIVIVAVCLTSCNVDTRTLDTGPKDDGKLAHAPENHTGLKSRWTPRSRSVSLAADSSVKDGLHPCCIAGCSASVLYSTPNPTQLPASPP